MSDWFTKLFINEAKPALQRHSNSGGGISDDEFTAISAQCDEIIAIQNDLIGGDEA